MNKHAQTKLLTAFVALTVMPVINAGIVTDFNAASDITNNFRETRVAANDMVFQSGAGSNGSTAGFVNITASADNGAIRYAYDADGAGAGTSTFSTGYIALDIRYNTANAYFGLYFGPSLTDAVGWSMRLDNGGTSENGRAVFGINNTNNFTTGTVLTTSSTTSATLGAATPAFFGSSTDLYNARPGITTGSWYSMRLDVGLDGSNNRTLQFRMWDSILDGTTGTSLGNLVWDHNITINGGAYNGVGEFGIFAGNNSSLNIDIDNFTVIPEPSAFAALAGLSALGLVAARRRRHS